MRNPIRDLCFLVIALSVAFSFGCSQPFTDIVANNSFDTGPWDVANAHVTDRQLTADVCMQQMDAAEVVSDRLLFQLRNKGYDEIQLAMYAQDDGQVQRQQVTWSASHGKQMQAASQSAENPCAAWQQAGGHPEAAGAGEHEQHDAAH